MKIAFLYGQFSLGPRPFDFDNLYMSTRGLTGSELSCVEYAKAMARRGHQVSLLVGQSITTREWNNLTIAGPLTDVKVVEGCDAVYAWNEPNLLRAISPGPLRMVNQQLNDFGYCQPGWEEYVDLLTSPSEDHLKYLRTQASLRASAVMPNGCDPSLYDVSTPRIPGRVVWASSADRGLHRLLEVWPAIKQRVPHASLRAYYNFARSIADEYEQLGTNVHPDLLEIAQRKRYIDYAMSRLQGPRWDVEHVGSVSRERMAAEFQQSMILGYVCDTIRYTEGFSVTTLEGCASGALPIITDIDALGSIYGSCVPMVALEKKTLSDVHLREFTNLVVRGLTDEDWRSERVAKCRAFAEKHSWDLLAGQLENLIDLHSARKLSAITSKHIADKYVSATPKNRKERRAVAASSKR